MKPCSYKTVLTDKMNELIQKFNSVYVKYKPLAPYYAQLQKIKEKAVNEDINEIFMQGIHHRQNFPIRFPDDGEINNSPINVLTNIMNTQVNEDAVTPFRSEAMKHMSLYDNRNDEVFPSIPVTVTAPDQTKLKFSPKLKQSQRLQINQLGISPIVQHSIKSPRLTEEQNPTLINNTTNKDVQELQPQQQYFQNIEQEEDLNANSDQEQKGIKLKTKNVIKTKQQLPKQPIKMPIRNETNSINMNNIKYYKNQLVEQRKKAVQLQQQLKQQKQENLQLQREKQRLIEEMRAYR